MLGRLGRTGGAACKAWHPLKCEGVAAAVFIPYKIENHTRTAFAHRQDVDASAWRELGGYTESEGIAREAHVQWETDTSGADTSGP